MLFFTEDDVNSMNVSDERNKSDGSQQCVRRIEENSKDSVMCNNTLSTAEHQNVIAASFMPAENFDDGLLHIKHKLNDNSNYTS